MVCLYSLFGPFKRPQNRGTMGKLENKIIDFRKIWILHCICKEAYHINEIHSTLRRCLFNMCYVQILEIFFILDLETLLGSWSSNKIFWLTLTSKGHKYAFLLICAMWSTAKKLSDQHVLCAVPLYIIPYLAIIAIKN